MKARKDLSRSLRVYGCWRRRARIARGLAEGILADWWDDLASFLLSRGHAWLTVRRVIEISKPFAAWAESLGVGDASAIEHSHIARYLSSGRRPKEGGNCLGLLMTFLQERGIVPEKKPQLRPTRPPAVIREYLEFLADHRGTGASTAEHHRRHIESLLKALCRRRTKKLRDLTGAELQRFITRRAAGLSPTGRKVLCAAIRSQSGHGI